MTSKRKKKIPELLSPAGSLSSGIAAIESGADAIYAGLSKFNARERTENFTLEEMSKLIAYARKYNKKVYITFNTLIKESELLEAAEAIYELSKLKPDALIIQDLGILYLIKNYFPELTIHASTQMGIHNSAGVNFARKLGISRVILERQITLEELINIKKNSSLELEIFIHGALCCSMSGNCILSSYLGGYSGNRGKCKQPCRKLYKNKELSGYFFSTKDLCSIDTIRTYKEIGIDSLKIEGRLRKSDYVRSVVSAYRLVLDSEDDSAIIKAKKILSQSSSRNFIAPFKTTAAFKNMIEPSRIGISGQMCAKVLNITQDGFNALITSSIHIGDRVRVQPPSGKEGPAFTITDLIINNQIEKKCTKGNVCFIKTTKIIPKNGIVYKIGESTTDMNSLINRLPVQKQRVDLRIHVTSNGIKVFTPKLNLPEWKCTETFSEARNNPISEEQISKEFSVTKSDHYESGQISVTSDKNLFIPLSILKAKRRDFWNWFEDHAKSHLFFQENLDAFNRFKTDYTNFTVKKDESKIKNETSVLINEKSQNPVPESQTIHTLDDFNSQTKEIILPEYCFEFNINKIKRKIKIAVTKGIKNFRVTSLYGFELLSNFKNLKITTSYPLPAANSLAIDLLHKTSIKSGLKLQKVQIWIELEKNEINNICKKSNFPLELYYYGRPYLLVSRAYIPVNGLISDQKNINFIIKKDTKNMLCYLYSDKVFKSIRLENFSLFFDLLNSNLEENETTSFNLNYNWF